MTVSTASSPSFFAARSMPPAKSFAVHDSGSPERARWATILSRSAREKSLMAAQITASGREVESHRKARLGHMSFRLRNRIGAEMEYRGGEHRRGVAVANAFHQM